MPATYSDGVGVRRCRDCFLPLESAGHGRIADVTCQCPKDDSVTKKLAKIPVFQPLVIGCYTMTAIGLEIVGEPDLAEHEAVGEFINRAHHSSGMWLADWLRYGDSRKDWKNRIEQAVEATGLAPKTLRNIRAVGAIDKSARQATLEIGHHEVVAALKPADQAKWLAKAAAGDWTVRDLRHAVQKADRHTVVEVRSSKTFTVEVVVSVEVEAQSAHRASSKAWEIVKTALAEEIDRGVIAKSSAKVIAATVRPE